MASRKLAGDSTAYAQLDSQDLDRRQTNVASGTEAQDRTTIVPRTVVRRRRPDPKPHSIQAMSLVGLKNLFFRRTVTPVPRSTSKYDWSNGSNQPLLQAGNRPSQPVNEEETHEAASIGSENTDVEEQSVDSKLEKTRQKKGFRVDARIISDATIGLSDGLTVPFALTAGLSALGNTKVVIYGGFAELIAGAISMGLGGYLGAKSEAASYKAQKEETQKLIATDPQAVMTDIAEVFEPYNLPKHTMEDLTKHLSNSPRLVDFVMQFQHCEEEPAANRALQSAITIALAYFIGGLLPLLPYFAVGSDAVYTGLYISIGVMVIALFLFGYIKTCVVVGWSTGRNVREGCYGGVQMVVVGSVAAGAAMGLVRLFSHDEGGVGM